MTEKWMDTIHNACKEISNEAYSLQELATAFHRTGNSAMAEELQQVARVLLTSSTVIPRAIGQHLSNECEKGRKSLALVIQAALT